MGPRRVLWVTEEPPDRSLGGGNIRQAHLFGALARAFPTDLLVVGSVTDEQVRAAAARIIELPKKTAPMTDDPVGRRTLELAITLGSRYPLPAYMAGPSRRTLGSAIKARPKRYDLVCVEHEALAPLISASRGECWLLTFHNLLSGVIEGELALAPGRRQRWFRERDLRKAQRLEQRALRRYDRCVVCSNDDADSLASIGADGARERIKVIPNGVDLGRFRSVPLPREPRVLFPGTFAYPPNVDGAVWFCSEIWPRVRSAVPDATLMLVGRAPVDEVRRLASKAGVSVHADVPSMVKYFESARVVVVPLRVGTGTRLKALEAMAAGRPVVGTSVGLQGIGVADGLHARTADDAERFAAAVIETLRYEELATALGEAGRAHVERRFGWGRIGSLFVAMASELVESAAARSSSRNE
jgi:glycosyltransferase involved in cell wall biosynthesis